MAYARCRLSRSASRGATKAESPESGSNRRRLLGRQGCYHYTTEAGARALTSPPAGGLPTSSADASARDDAIVSPPHGPGGDGRRSLYSAPGDHRLKSGDASPDTERAPTRNRTPINCLLDSRSKPLSYKGIEWWLHRLTTLRACDLMPHALLDHRPARVPGWIRTTGPQARNLALYSPELRRHEWQFYDGAQVVSPKTTRKREVFDEKVDPRGLEPRTSCLQDRCSTYMSYRPVCRTGWRPCGRTWDGVINHGAVRVSQRSALASRWPYVPSRGIEPLPTLCESVALPLS